MKKIKVNMWLKRILAIVLVFAMSFHITPESNTTVEVEAAGTGTDFGLQYLDPNGGMVLVKDGAMIDYVGLTTAMSITVVRIASDGKPTEIEPGVTYAWSSSYSESITLGTNSSTSAENGLDKLPESELNKQIFAYKKGPGTSNIRCTITLVNGNTVDVSISLKVPLKINKGSTNRANDDGDPFTLLLSNRPEENNTALMFFEGTDTKAKKEVTLLEGTKPTTQTVQWISSIPEVAPNPTIEAVPGKNHVRVYVEGKKAGITKITANVTSSKESDSFYAIVTPQFWDNSSGAGATKQWGTKDNPKVMEGGRFLNTNAVDASTLTWKVWKVDPNTGKETDAKGMINLTPQRDGRCYIEENPRSGLYKITVQTVPEGMTMDPDKGIATAYVKIPLLFMDDNSSTVMNVGDSYDVFTNTTAQSAGDLSVIIASGDIYDPDQNPNGKVTIDEAKQVITGKNQGLAAITVKIKNDDIAKNVYGITKTGTPEEYKKFVDPGTKFSISVMEGFNINSRAMTIKVKQQQKLEVSTNSVAPITWTTTDPNIVNFTSKYQNTCVIEGINVGTATIHVTQVVNKITRRSQCEVTVMKAADNITIEPSSVQLNIDDLKTLNVRYSPADRIGTLNWTSTNPKVVAVSNQTNESAQIKGISGGTATIMAVNKDNSTVATCDVTVYGKITALNVVPDVATVNFANGQLQLMAAVEPTTETVPGITWTSGDPKIATVDKDKGLVKFVAPGTVTIFATAKNNSELRGTSIITIVKSAGGLKLDSSNKVMYVGESSKLGVTFTPADTANQKIKWRSSNPTVASVDTKDGNVTALKVGETTIIAQAEDGNWIDTCVISVKEKAKGITITTKDIILNKGETYDIKYTVDPPSATDFTISWVTSNASVATVSATGKVTAVSVGSAIISAKTANGEVTYCNVTVVENADGLQLNFYEKTIYTGNTFTLRATILPVDVSNTKVTWKTSNSKIATVSTKGVVKGLIPGTAIITCISTDGGYEARCVVTVKKMVSKIKLNYTSYSLGLNKKLQLKATVTSTNATKKKIKWTSSNPGIVYVSSNGLITGRKLGTATVSVHSLDGSGSVARCKVTVVRATTSITLSKRNIVMISGRTTKLKATVWPKTATYRTVKWSSDNEEVVTVAYDGTLTALKPGNAKIMAKSKDSGGSKKAYCVVIVKDQVSATGITITTKNPTMIPGQSITMQKAVTPAQSTDKITWSSDNTMVATVNSSGRVTARSAGTAGITAISESGKTDSTTVTVVGMSQKSITMEQYSKYTLYVTGATGTVRWTVANPTIAVVSDGVVESRKPGTTTVFANVNGVQLSCKVTVTNISN